MMEILTLLGIQEGVLNHFKGSYSSDGKEGILFKYGAGVEHFGPGFHRVPSFKGYWKWPAENSIAARKMIICNSGMEAISWLNVHYHGLSIPDELTVVAAGLLSDSSVYELIARNRKRRKIALVLGNDLLGRISDIKMALRILGKDCKMKLLDSQVSVEFNGKTMLFPEEKLSLSAFEVRTGLRSGIRTFKPKRHQSYLAQLIANI